MTKPSPAPKKAGGGPPPSASVKSPSVRPSSLPDSSSSLPPSSSHGGGTGTGTGGGVAAASSQPSGKYDVQKNEHGGVLVTQAEIDAAFDFFDTDGTGKITMQSLKKRLGVFYKNMPNKEFRFLLNNKTGELCWERAGAAATERRTGASAAAAA